MKVGLIPLDCKLPPLSLMKAASYHRSRGDSVEVCLPMFYQSYDICYCCSLFDYTPKPHFDSRVICGGPGYDANSRLPEEIENCQPDYGLFPGLDFSYQKLTTGCIRRCPFCICRDHEFADVEPLQEINPDAKYIYLLDNNFFASKNWKKNIDILKSYRLPVYFQGIDARIVSKNKEMLNALAKIKITTQGLYMAWDDPAIDMTETFQRIIEIVPPSRLTVYVLIGYYNEPIEKDLWRVEALDGMKIDPYVMPFDRKDKYQSAFSAWVNQKPAFRSHRWEDYFENRTGLRWEDFRRKAVTSRQGLGQKEM